MCAGDQEKQRQYLARLMAPPNSTWGQILAQAQANPEVLKQQEVIKSLQNVLQTNVSVCTSLGNPYISQMAQMVDSMLQVGWVQGWVAALGSCVSWAGGEATVHLLGVAVRGVHTVCGSGATQSSVH